MDSIEAGRKQDGQPSPQVDKSLLGVEISDQAERQNIWQGWTEAGKPLMVRKAFDLTRLFPGSLETSVYYHGNDPAVLLVRRHPGIDPLQRQELFLFPDLSDRELTDHADRITALAKKMGTSPGRLMRIIKENAPQAPEPQHSQFAS